jgi:hypothetical protein
MTNPAWDYLRENFDPDHKGRFKTTDAMKVAVHFMEEAVRLKAENVALNIEIIKLRDLLRMKHD